MSYELVAKSRVQLTAKLAVNDLQDETWTLATIGEAMIFIDSNFSQGRKTEGRWQHAARCLALAAASDDYLQRERATQAVSLLLQSEGMLVH